MNKNRQYIILLVVITCMLIMSIAVNIYQGNELQRLRVINSEAKDLDPYIEELFNSPNGGIFLLPQGEYSASSIYGENGFIRWGE